VIGSGVRAMVGEGHRSPPREQEVRLATCDRSMEKQLREWLGKGQLWPIADLAQQNRRVLSVLSALTFDPEPSVAWRAVEAMGLAAGSVADEDAEFVRGHLRRQLWLLSDESGGIGWRAPEIIGEIIHARPALFADFMPILISLLDMEAEDAVRFRAGTLWAIGRVAQVKQEAMQEAIPSVVTCLNDPDPRSRGMAAWCLGQLGAGELVASHRGLLCDDSPVDFYHQGQITTRSVASLAREALTFRD